MKIAGAGLSEWVEQVQLTEHAEVRARQRGFREHDAEVILTFGTATDEGGVLTDRDARRAIDELKRQIAAVERLAGAAVVTDGLHVITIYHSRRTRSQHMLRRAGRRCSRS